MVAEKVAEMVEWMVGTMVVLLGPPQAVARELLLVD